MTQIVLDNIHPDVLEKIRNLAQKHNRSLEDEIKTILAQAAETDAVEKREINISQAWSKIDEARQRYAGKIFSDSVELLREDRNR
ncbi:hypothetical protein ACE1CI_09355 [Aerosakkonemataceae cyanobacterium BLCC-F50]|uniref:Antitoxin FitA-like ribbon-helix-helix domain-containing protein n=1 Tax=Floridaenema flaviceps BLCC-F50 TaxID=3153642 RepID=A0ABV4XN25_9CYAN